MPQEEGDHMNKSLTEIDNPGIAVEFICINSPLDIDEKQQLLECMSIEQRMMLLTKFLNEASELMQIRQDLTEQTQARITQQQREHFLRQQINTIEDQLGGTIEDEEMNELDARAEKRTGLQRPNLTSIKKCVSWSDSPPTALNTVFNTPIWKFS